MPFSSAAALGQCQQPGFLPPVSGSAEDPAGLPLSAAPLPWALLLLRQILEVRAMVLTSAPDK